MTKVVNREEDYKGHAMDYWGAGNVLFCDFGGVTWVFFFKYL